MSKSIISENAGRIASVMDAISTGISAAGGNPDIEIVRIIGQSGLSREIGKLIMEKLFPTVEERRFEVNFRHNLRELLQKLTLSADARATFRNEDVMREYCEILDKSGKEAEEKHKSCPRVMNPYRIVSLSRRMAPNEITEFYDGKSYPYPVLREALQVTEARRKHGSISTKKTIILGTDFFSSCVYVDQSGTFGFHSLDEELPIGTEIILSLF